MARFLNRREAASRILERLAIRAGVDLAPAETWLLARLHRDPDLDPPSLADAYEIDPARLDRALQRLEEDGLVVDAGTGSLPSHPLTAAGTQTLDHVVVCGRDRLNELSSGWEPEQHPELRELIDALAREILSGSPAASSRTGPVSGCLEDGAFAVMAAVDRELRLAGVKTYAWLPGGTPFVVGLFDLERAELAGVIEADKRAAPHRRRQRCRGKVPRPRRRRQPRRARLRLAGSQPRSPSIREALPAIERVVAYCRTPESLARGFATRRAPSPGSRIATRPGATWSSR